MERQAAFHMQGHPEIAGCTFGQEVAAFHWISLGTAVALARKSTTVGSGGSVGCKGPTGQMCAAVGASIARLFPMPAAPVRLTVHTACVSGAAAAFNPPITAMASVMEEIIGDRNVRQS
jgi:CIC family chloride channel protein